MTDWAKDLQDLLGGIGSGVGTVNENLGGVPGNIGGGIQRASELGLDTTKFAAGTLLGGINEGLGLLPGQPGFEPATSRALHHGAFGQEAGPRAAWEQVRSEEPWWFQLPTEVLMDPMTVTGLPLTRGSEITKLGGISRAFEEAALNPRGPISELVAGTGADLTRGADLLYNQLPWAATKAVVSPFAKGAKWGIQKISPTAFEYSPRTVVKRNLSDIGSAWTNDLAADEGLPGQLAVIPGTTKTISPFGQYDVPPFFDTEYDAGVPKRIKEMAWESWQALRMSQPELTPGITAPGSRATQQAEDQFRSAGILGKIPGIGGRNQPLGFIPPPPGGYSDIGSVQLDEENLRHMATIGAAIMMDYDNDVSNRLFGRLIQASEGPQAVKQAVSELYGSGITPYGPGAYDEMAGLVREGGQGFRPPGEAGITSFPGGGDLPSARFFGETGWPEGVVPTDRLNAIQDKLNAGTITEAQALEALQGSGFHAATPEVTETAAGFGAGFLGASREMDTADAAQKLYNPFTGSMRPTEMDPLTGRAKVPSGFPEINQFDKNAAAYHTYMTSLFGQMPENQLEVMRKMSIEVIYNEMLNSAAPFTGGTNPATAFLEGTAKRTTSTAKLGGLPDPNDARQIGNRLDEITGFGGDVKYTTGRPTMRSLNAAYLSNTLKTNITKEEYLAITGKKATGRELTNAHIVEMIEAKGGTPFTENKIGGPLPNAQHLIDLFNVGKDLQAGSYPATEFYAAAGEELVNLVGPGRYEDAEMLTDLLGITSAGEGVQANAKNMFRLFAEWKVGSPEFAKSLQEDFGMTSDEVLQLLQQNGEWSDPHQIFRHGIKEGMRDLTTGAFNEYVARKEGGHAWQSVQGGPKTTSYTMSTMLNVWHDAIDYALASQPKLHKIFKDGLAKASEAAAWDRHQSRVMEGPTAVSPMQAIAMRELHNIAAHEAGVSPERFQSGLWYLVKDAQGFRRVGREDDVIQAIRKAWQEGIPASKMAEVRQLVDDNFPGMRTQDPESFDDYAQSFADQEALYTVINENISNYRDWSAASLSHTFKTPIEALFGMTDDTLGIVNRANRGVPPRRKPDVFQLYDLTKDILPRIRSGDAFGATFGWDGVNWVPESPTGGFAVALTSAGKSVSTAKPKTAERALQRMILEYTDLIDDPRYAEKIKVGAFPMDAVNKEASLDLTLVVPDERMATSLAKRFNQQSIYDFSTGNLIHTGGTGDPVTLSSRELRSIVDSIYGRPPPLGSGPHAQARRGLFLKEANPLNPDSIMNRRVLGPIMDAFHTKSVETLPGPRGGNPIDIGLPGPVPEDTIFDFEKVGQKPGISTQENMVLNQPLKDGAKVRDRLGQYLAEAKRDVEIVKASPIRWKARATAADRLKLVENDAELTRIVKKYNDLGIDIGYVSPKDVSMERLSKELHDEAGIVYEKDTTYDLFKASWGELALFSPKFHTGNISGAVMQNAIGGHYNLPGPDQFAAAWKYLRAGQDEVTRQEAMHSLHTAQTYQKWGFPEPPAWLNKGGTRGMTGSGTRSSTGKFVGKITRNERLGSLVGIPFELSADLSTSSEHVLRGSVAEDVLDREMIKQMPAFEASLNRMADKMGLESFEFSILDNINPVPGGPTPGRLKDHLQRLGLSEGYAERAQRNFAEAKNFADGQAKSEVERIQFSYDRTNLDEFVGKFIPFHYWASRALRYYGENSLRHPYLLVNYMRLQDGIEDAQNDPGLSARQKGFIKLIGTPLGFTMLMNPEAMIGITKIFGLDTYEDPTDTQISAGKVIDWAKQRGIGFYPWIEGILNLMGVLGDTYEPDLLGIRHKALIGAGINFMRSQLGMEPAGSPYAQAMGQLRGTISGFVSQFTPDWLTQQVTPRAGGSLTDASMDTVIESRIMARNPGLTNGELLDIMADPDSPEFDAAYRDAAGAGIIQQLLNFTLPQTYKLKEDTRDVRAATVSTIYEAAQKAGVSPYEFKPSVADIKFAARYEELTGKTWKPGDYEDAQQKQVLARTVPEGKNLAYQTAEYHNLGTDEQQRRFKKYSDIVNGVTPQTATLDYGVRRELANAWASRLGYGNDINDVYQLQDAWEQSHPEFAAYKGWETQMWQLYNHLGGSLVEYRRQASEQNPNAARYFSDKERDIRSRFPGDQVGAEMDRATVSMDAYTAVNGMSQSRYDQGPIPGVSPVDVTLPTITNQLLTQGGSQNTDWMQSLRNVAPGYGTDTFGTWWNH